MLAEEQCDLRAEYLKIVQVQVVYVENEYAAGVKMSRDETNGMLGGGKEGVVCPRGCAMEVSRV